MVSVLTKWIVPVLGYSSEGPIAAEPTPSGKYTDDEPKLRLSIRVQEGQRPIRPVTYFHNLYTVTLKNGEIWAVDTTGAQFGYADPLYLWHDLEQRRLGQILVECAFGHERYKGCQSIALDAFKNGTARKTDLMELTEAPEDKVPALAAELGPELHTIWRASDAAFQQAKDKFLNQLNDSIRSIIMELGTPAQVMRRKKEVEYKISKNMSDPEARKKSEVMMDVIERSNEAIRGVHS